MQCLTCTRLTCWGPWCPPLAACRPCPLWPASASAHGARPCPPGLRSTATHNKILDTKKRKQRGCSSVGRASNWHNADTGSIPWCGKEFFSQRQLSVQTLFCSVRTPLCAVACINICVHVKDPVVHVRVWWIIKTLKPNMHHRFFQCRLSYGAHTPLCAIACIYIRVHVKDPIVHVRVQWIIKTLKT